MHQLVDEHRQHNDTRKADREGLIKHYGHRLMMRQRRYRIYLKYYPGGDLIKALQYNTKIHADMLRPDHIPERFIWHVLECLVKACRVLRTGADRPIPEGDEDEHLFKDWKPITHLDISARNLFMEELVNSENPVSSPKMLTPSNRIIPRLTKHRSVLKLCYQTLGRRLPN